MPPNGPRPSPAWRNFLTACVFPVLFWEIGVCSGAGIPLGTHKVLDAWFTMADDDPITCWVAQLKADERDAARKLWQRYFHRVAGMARKILAAGPRGGADEEDVAQSAFRSFFIRARKGHFPQLNDRDDLWKLLVTITIRKAVKQKRKLARQPIAIEDVEEVNLQLAERPTPEFVVALQDEMQRLLGLLDATEQRVAGLILEGRTTEEIAAFCMLSRSTIERKRKLIRETWLRETGP